MATTKKRSFVIAAILLAVGVWFAFRFGRGENAESKRGAKNAAIVGNRGRRTPGLSGRTIPILTTKAERGDAAALEVVLTSAADDPVVKATVDLQRHTDGSTLLGVWETFASCVATEGVCNFEKLPPGTYRVTGAAEGRRPAQSEPVPLGPGTRGRLSLLLVPGGFLVQGKISDADHGVLVDPALVAISIDKITQNDGPSFTATVDGSGSYRLRLATGRYLLVAFGRDHALERTPLALRADTTRDFQLSVGNTITGRVVAESGDAAAASSAEVVLRDLRYFREQRVTAAADGSFTFRNIGAGSYGIAASKGGSTSAPQDISFSGQPKGADVVLRLEPGFEVTGAVEDGAGQPVAGASVRVISLLDERTPARTAVTNADGSFAVGPCNPGRYRVFAAARGHTSNSDAVDLLSTSAPPVHLRLLAGASLKGVVQTRTGQYVARKVVLVSVQYANDREGKLIESSTFETTTDGGGEFLFTTLPAGRATVEVRENETTTAVLTDVGLVPAETTDVTLTVADRARISGVVLSADRRPMGGVEVGVRPEWSPRSGASTTTTRDGTFELSLAAPEEGGKVLVMAAASLDPPSGGDRRPQPRAQQAAYVAPGHNTDRVQLVFK
jgi:hypothetical protein